MVRRAGQTGNSFRGASIESRPGPRPGEARSMSKLSDREPASRPLPRPSRPSRMLHKTNKNYNKSYEKYKRHNKATSASHYVSSAVHYVSCAFYPAFYLCGGWFRRSAMRADFSAREHSFFAFSARFPHCASLLIRSGFWECACFGFLLCGGRRDRTPFFGPLVMRVFSGWFLPIGLRIGLM